MSASNNSDKVLIIGAGVGGLALAQYLRKQNIAYEIFERDTSAGSRAQGWAVALVECLAHLRDYLPSDIGSVYSTSVTGENDVADELAVVDLTTGATMAKIGNTDPTVTGHLVRAGRAQLRHFLWQNIPVVTGKQFSHYREDADGVTAFFKDGTSAHGSILIGADGASSHVRAQLLGAERGHAELSSFIPLIGECTLTRAQFEPITAMANAVIVAGDLQNRLVIGRRSTSPDGETADHFYILAYHSDNPTADAAWTHAASKQELFAKAQEIATKELPPNVAHIVHLTGVEGMVAPPILFREFVPLPAEAMPKGRVSVLGDAAHAMVPFKGAGANTAIEDAFDLMDLIVKKQEQSWEDVIARYNEKMTVRGQEKVLASRRAGTETSGAAVLEGRMGA